MLDLAVAPGGALAAMHLGEYGARGDARRAGGAARLGAVALRQPHQARGSGARRVWSRSSRRRPTSWSSTCPASELEAAGLTCEQLREHNPSLVHAWMPPHAPSGETADLPYDELLLWAWTGLAAQQPGATSDHPVASVVPIITYEQGALGACAIGAALVERSDAGHGARVHGVGPPRGQRDEHVDPHRLPRHLPAVRRQQGRHRRVAAVPHVPLPRRRVAVRVRAHAVVLLQAARSARP